MDLLGYRHAGVANTFHAMGNLLFKQDQQYTLTACFMYQYALVTYLHIYNGEDEHEHDNVVNVREKLAEGRELPV